MRGSRNDQISARFTCECRCESLSYFDAKPSLLPPRLSFHEQSLSAQHSIRRVQHQSFLNRKHSGPLLTITLEYFLSQQRRHTGARIKVAHALACVQTHLPAATWCWGTEPICSAAGPLTAWQRTATKMLAVRHFCIHTHTLLHACIGGEGVSRVHMLHCSATDCLGWERIYDVHMRNNMCVRSRVLVRMRGCRCLWPTC